MRNGARSLLLLLTLVLLAGCNNGGTTDTLGVSQTASSSTSSMFAAGGLTGVVQSGGTSSVLPLAGARVTLYEAGDGGTAALATVVSDAAGRFALPTPRTTSTGVFYVTADLGNGVQLLDVVGISIPSSVTINELTTVAGSYAFAQFVPDGTIRGSSFQLRLASGMNDNLVSPVTGASSSVMLNAPNADQTNGLRSTRALANLLAGYVRTQGADIGTLFALTTPPGGTAPTTLVQALSNLARNPQLNVATIYAKSKGLEVYTPSLTRQPDAWTLVVKVNQTGDPSRLFGGPARVKFDRNGYAWVNNNVFQGGPDSVTFNIVLKPNGQPADGASGGPTSPLLGGGIFGPGYGMDIDGSGFIWVGNFGWGGTSQEPSPTGYGSVCQFDPNGRAISPPSAFQGGPVRVQGISHDAQGNIWVTSYGNDRVYVFPNRDPNKSFFYQEEAGSLPFEGMVAADGTAWVTNSGGLTPNSVSSVARFAIVNGQLQRLFKTTIGHSDKGMALDSQGNAWVASGGDSTVYEIDPNGAVIGRFSGVGGMDSPWSCAVDGDDNVWVANFGPMAAGNDFTTSAITKLAGNNPATRPPGSAPGDPISPATGYTLPNEGQEILLSDGSPLYPHGPKCFSPLMRMTSVNLDQAGNIWAVNNWKPNFDIDVAHNPGGDGICIFVGLAKPPKP